MTARPGDLLLHLARTIVTLAAFALLAATGHLFAAAFAAAAAYLAAFAFSHDLAHGALGVPRRLRSLALALAAQPMLLSGHRMRALHLRHHARPFAADDLEGAVADVPLGRALLALPRLFLAMRRVSDGLTSPRRRRWERGETMLNLAVLALATISPAIAVYAAVALALQLTAPIWGGRIPHRAPAWLLRWAQGLAFTRSAVLLSLAFHDQHHQNPTIPCHRLHA